MSAAGSYATPEVAVVVSTYQRAGRLARLVAALEAQTIGTDRFEVVLVDNGTTDATASVLDAIRERSTLRLHTPRIEVNAGPVPARNLGWRSSAAPWVAFTDDDCIPDPDWLAAGLRAAGSDGDLGIVQGRTLPARTPVRVWSSTRRVEQLSGLFEGCNLFVRRRALETTGGFDDRFVFYGEDTSMGWAVVERGFACAFAPEAVVRHAVTRPPFRTRLRERSMEANLVRVARLHPGFRTEVCWRPWAYRRENVLHLLAVVALVGATRRIVFGFGVLPWLVARWPAGRPSRAGLVHLAKRFVDDSVGSYSMVRASVEERTLLL